MKYSVEIDFNGIVTQYLEGIGFPNQIIRYLAQFG